MRALRVVSFSLVVLVLTARSTTAGAADAAAEARLRDALRSTTSQLRSLQDEQVKWQAKEAEYQKQLEALKAELAQAKKRPARKVEDQELKQRLAEQVEAKAKATESLAQCQKEARDRAAAEAVRAKEHDDERADLTGRLDGLTSRAAACEARNARLVATGKEIVRWMAGIDENVCEPFLGLRRVELENKAQDFEDKLLDQEVRPAGARR